MSRSRTTKTKDLNYDESSEAEISYEDPEKKLLQRKRGRDSESDDEEFEEDDISQEVVSDESLEDIDLDKEGLNSGKKKKPAKKDNKAAEKQAKAGKDKAVKTEKKKKTDDEKKEKKEKVKKEKAEKKEKKEKKPKELLDSTYSLEEKYFYQTPSDEEWKSIRSFLNDYFKSGSSDLKAFFALHPKLKKGSDNLTKLRSM
jgi:hypothetical protein